MAGTSGSSASRATATGRRSPASPATRSGSTTRASPPPLDRALHAAELIALLDEAWATKTLDEWAPLFDAEPDMFWSRVQDPFEVVNDPTLRAAGGIVDVPDGVATTPMIATPVDFHGTPWTPRGLAPELGQHTDEVLREIGR